MDPVIEHFGRKEEAPLVSIIVLNYNSAQWLEKCFASIKNQTIYDRIETILVDNNSKDDSIALTRKIFADFQSACLVISSENLGFCEGNNCGARVARGKWLFILNPDTWMEPDCMEKTIAGTEKLQADASTPLVLNYPDNSFQHFGFFGYDLFGLPSPSSEPVATREVFIIVGCCYLIRAEVFARIGMFDKEYFMYAEDCDLSWRVWIGGYKAVGIFEAKLHHRGAAGVNPSGGAELIEMRTSDKKRYWANRNSILTLLKDAQHLLLLMILPLTALLFLESIMGALLLRRWSFMRASFWDVLGDCWRLRKHVWQQRKIISRFRKRSDFWMLRFFRLRLNRWDDVRHMLKLGLPRVDAR